MSLSATFDQSARLAMDNNLLSLFAAETDRAKKYVVETCGIRFDFAKTHLMPQLIQDFAAGWAATHQADKVNSLLSGALINGTENRAALHTAWRAAFVPAYTADGAPVAALVAEANARMQALIADWRASDATAIIHIGIGGSALGPELALRALEPISGKRFDVRLLANVDGEAFERAIAGLNPRTVRVVIASKSWTTQETQHNAEKVRAWLIAGGVADPGSVMAAVTQKVDAAAAWGIPQARVLPNPAWVGGRYSVWSPIGLPVALQIGWEAFEEFRAGAGAMDRHMATAPVAENACLLAALIGFCYAEYAGSRARALFSYDERLRLLPAHLSQLELESLGKSVDIAGNALAQTCPSLWGGTGTDAQHAVFQYLHQGTDLVPLDFVAVKSPDHGNSESHRLLLANCFAQGAALMQGRNAAETATLLRQSGLPEAEIVSLAPHMTFPGNRPSTMILLDKLTPATLGALIAFYEHRTFAQSLLWNINPFDQFGVELGKNLATQILADRGQSLDASTRALAAMLPWS
jgi:glucose-6-phosphate isomerase